MEVRTGGAQSAGRPGWLMPLVGVGALVAGGLLVVAVLLGWRLLTGPDVAPQTSSAPQTSPVPVDAAVCDVGDPYFRGSGPHHDRLHGGGLGMPLPAGLTFGDPARMPYAFDVALVQSPDAETWAGVGAVRIEDPFSTPEQASGTATACLTREYATAQLRISESAFVEVPGATQAHERIGTLTEEGTTREFRVLIADTGSPESLAVYVRVAQPDTPQADALLTAETQLAGG